MSAVLKALRWWAVLALGIASVRAHDCGPAKLTLRVGQTVPYRITADVAESETSHYELSINARPAVASVFPDNQDTLGFGEFLIRGEQVGTNNLVIEWSYAPNRAQGFCVVAIEVVETAADPRDEADETTAGEATESGVASDPVNTYTGEFVLEEASDLDLGGPFPVRFLRYYASGLHRQALVHGALGHNWTHDYEIRLVRDRDDRLLVLPRGRVVRFRPTAEGWRASDSAVPNPMALREEGTRFLAHDPAARRVMTFDAQGGLVRWENELGQGVDLTWVDGRIASVSDGLGRVLRFAYAGHQHLISVSDGERAVRFVPTGETLGAVVRPDGHQVRYEYDPRPEAEAWMTARVSPSGARPLVQEYDALGRVVKQTRATGGVFSFRYDGLVTVVTASDGRVERHLHDAGGRLVEVQDPARGLLRWQYDAFGRRVSDVDATGREVRWEYEPGGSRVRATKLPGGLVLSWGWRERSFRGFAVYDADRITYLDGAEERFEYDATGRMTAMVDRVGRRSTLGHDAAGRWVATTNAAGGVTRFEYANDGTRVARILLGNGRPDEVTRYAYDSLRRMVRVTHPDGAFRTYTYDTNDRMVEMRDEAGAIHRWEFTPDGFLASHRSPLGRVNHAYDAMGDLVRVTDAAGQSVVRSLDPMGRLVSQRDRGGVEHRFEYDAAGRWVVYRDGAGMAWSREYDGGGRLTAIVDPRGNRRAWAYDVLGRVQRLSAPAGRVIEVGLDPMGRPVRMQWPEGEAVSFTHAADDALLSVALPDRGMVLDLESNELGQAVSRRDATGAAWRRLTDAHGRPIGLVDPLNRTQAWVVHPRGQVIEQVLPFALGRVVREYDGRGLPTRVEEVGGGIQTLAHDAEGRLTSGTGIQLAYRHDGAITNCNGLEIERDAAGRILTVGYGAGRFVGYTHDARGLVTNVTDWLGGSTSLQYDAAGVLQRMVRNNGVVTSFTHDAAQRLTAIDEAGAAVQARAVLVRNARGQIVEATRAWPSSPVWPERRQSFAHDAAGQMTGVGYDGLGRVLSEGGRRFRWNALSQLTGWDRGTSTSGVEFRYDGLGRLRERLESGRRREWVWNYALQLPMPVLLREEGQDVLYVVTLPDGPLLYVIEAASARRVHHHFDEMGNTVFLTDDSGKVTDAMRYSPCGVLLAREGTFQTPFTYGGRYGALTEAGAGIHCFQHRWYDPELARFLSRDPLAGRSRSPAESNPYGFNRGNPLLYIDPLGLNARVNQSGVHTDISVDVWDGDRVAGTLTLSYSAKGYNGSLRGFEDAWCTVVWGTPGEFDVDFKRGSVRETSDPAKIARGNHVIIEGTREQDERLLRVFAGLYGSYSGEPHEARGRRLIEGLIRASAQRKSYSIRIDATVEEWQYYRAMSNCCNDFTDAMLDVYFGENWYLGPIFEGDGVMEELKGYLKDHAPRRVSPDGIAPVTGDSRTAR